MSRTIVVLLVVLLPWVVGADTRIGLQWAHDDLAAVDTFVIERSLDDQGTWHELARVPVPALSFTYVTTDEGMQHCYRSFAVRGPEKSGYATLLNDPTKTVLCLHVPAGIAIKPGHSFEGGRLPGP